MRSSLVKWRRAVDWLVAVVVVVVVAGKGARVDPAPGRSTPPPSHASKPPERLPARDGNEAGRTAAGSPDHALAKSPKAKPTPPPPLVIEGLVKDAAGKPVHGARVYVRPSTERGFSNMISPRPTGMDGTFRLDLRSRLPHDVRVEARGFGPWGKERVAPGTRLEAVLDTGRAIDGIVRDEFGQPSPGATVEAVSRGGFGGYWDAEGGVRRTETDAGGRFRLEGLDQSLHMVSAWVGSGRAQRRSVRTGTSITLNLRPLAVITGVVTDTEGRPVVGALVRHAKEPLFWDQGFLVATGAYGRFEIVGVEAGQYTVAVRHPGFAPTFSTGVNVTARGQAEVRLALHTGAPLEGRLVDADGKPIVGRVALNPAEAQAPPAVGELLKAETDSDGRFRISRVAPGEYALTAIGDGFAPQRAEVIVGDRTPVVDMGHVVLGRGLAIRGHVRTVAGLPVTEANVSCRGDGRAGSSWTVETRSLADGSFVLAGLASEPDELQLEALASGYARGRARAEVGADNVVLVLHPGGGLTGRVIEEGDRPVEAYHAHLKPSDADQSQRLEEGRAETVASSDGTFSFEDLEESSYVLQVVVPEQTPVAIPRIMIAAGRTTDAGTIRVSRGGTIKGTVASHAGGGIVGAAVSLRTRAEDLADLGQWSDALVTQSETDGGFEIRGAPTGMATLQASHPDYADTSVLVEVNPANGPTEAHLVLSRGGRIEGTARRRDGTPLTGQAVHVSPQEGGGLWDTLPLATTADGSFAVDHVPPGPLEVVLMAAVAPGVFTNRAHAEVVVREAETALVSLVAGDILLSGRVMRAGNPLAGALVEAHRSEATVFTGNTGDRSSAASAGPEGNSAMTREDGSYEMILSAPGQYSSWVRHGDQNLPRRFFDVPDVDAYVMDFSYSGTAVGGVVVDKETGEPPLQAEVSTNWIDNGGGSAGADTGPDGRFEMDVEPGRRTITAWAEGYAATTVETDVPPEGISDVRFELEKALTLKGRLLDPDGQRLSGIRVNLHSGGARPIRNGTQTLRDGSFVFEDLKEGTYSLCAGSPEVGYAVHLSAAAGVADVTLTVRPGSRLEVRTFGPDGAPKPQAMPRVRRVGGVEVIVPTEDAQPVTDATGRTTIDVPAGMLEIIARDKMWQGTASVTVGEGGTASVEILMNQPVERLQ